MRPLFPPRSALLPLALVLACTPPLPPRGQAGMRAIDFPLRTLRLPSGLQVVIEEDHRSPVVAVITLVGAGSAEEPPGKEGLAHLVEHLTFRARPDTRTSMWRQLEQLGAARFDAETSFDSIVYSELAPAKALPQLLRLEGTRLTSPLADLDQDTFDLERAVVRDELRVRNELGVQGQIVGWVQEALFPTRHPYAHALAGTRGSLDSLTLADAQAFAGAWFQPRNATWVIVGDIDLRTVDQVILNNVPPGLLAAAPELPPGPRFPPEAPPPPAPPDAPMARHEAPVARPEVWIGWSIPRSYDADHYLQQFAIRATYNVSAFAFRRDDDIHDISVHLIPGAQASLLLFRVVLVEGTHPEISRERVLDQILRLWSPTADEGVVQSEYFYQRRWIAAATDMAFRSEDLIERGKLRAGFAHFSGDPTLYTRGLERIRPMAPSNLSAFVAQYLDRYRARAVLVVPPSLGNSPGAVSPNPALRPAPAESLPPPPDRLAAREAAKAPGASAFKQVTLPNGLELIIGRRTGLPVATVAALVRGGAGASSPVGAEQLLNQVSEQGAHFNGNPLDYGVHVSEAHEVDGSVHVLQGGAGNVQAMLAMIAERLQTRRIDEGAEVSFRQYRVPALKAYDTWPDQRAARAFWAALLGDHDYGHLATGEDLENVTLQEARDWLARTYAPKNTVIVVLGEIDPDEVERSARAWLGGWSHLEDPVPVPPPPSGLAPGLQVLVTQQPGATQGELTLGCLLPPADDQVAVRNDLMAEVLGERLRTLTHDQLGAANTLRSSASTVRGGATYLLVQGSVGNRELPRALAGLHELTAALAQGQFAPGEVDRARWRLANQCTAASGVTPRLAVEVLHARNRGWPVASIDAYAERLGVLTEADVQGGFAACAGGRRVLSIVGDEAVVQPALKGSWR